MEFIILLVVGGILWFLLWLLWVFLQIVFRKTKYAFVVRGDDSMLGGWEYQKYFEDEKAARSVYKKLQLKYEYTQMEVVTYQGEFDPDKTIFFEDHRK